jgi:D-serine dehydratase
LISGGKGGEDSRLNQVIIEVKDFCIHLLDTKLDTRLDIKLPKAIHFTKDAGIPIATSLKLRNYFVGILAFDGRLPRIQLL